MSTRRKERPLPGFVNYFAAGRMSLWLAWLLALFTSAGLSLVLADVNLGTLPFAGGQVAVIFVLFVVPPTLVSPAVARYKHRSVAKWSFVAFAAMVLSPFLPFLPLTELLTLTLGVGVPIKVPEAELEAAENPRAMRQLVAAREGLWKVYQQTEDRYVHKDFSVLSEVGQQVEPIANRLDGLREQVSERGRGARMRLQSAVEQLAGVGEQSAGVLAENPDSPELMALAAQGSTLRAKGKQQKALANRLRNIEVMLNGSRVQIGIAGTFLERLGYTADDESPEQEALVDGDEDVDEPMPALPPPPTASRPRPRRPVRRRRH